MKAYPPCRSPSGLSISRNAVIGKIHRLRARRATSSSRASVSKEQRMQDASARTRLQ
jgi:hypothetical protein